MKEFDQYLDKVENLNQKERIEEILTWISKEYPFLERRLAWNQPHFVNQGTYIIGLSYAKQNVAIAPEQVTLQKYKDVIEKNGYTFTNNLIRIKWNQDVDYNLLKQMIDFNIEEKKGYKTYWRNA